MVTLLADLAMCLIVEHARERSLVHHLFANGEDLVYGMMAAMAVLIAVARLVKLESKSSSLEISAGAGSLFSKDVRYSWNSSQSTCR